jgi:hypothetical protein
MARVLIRNDTREILFFTHKSRFSDIDPRIVGISAKYPGNTTFLTISNAAHVPNNLRLGSYIDSTNSIVSEEPFGDVLLAKQRKAMMESKLDEHKEMIRNGALVGITPSLADRWYKYLRMMAQAAMRDEVLTDADQWALVEKSLDVDPYDLENFTATQDAVFDSTFADEGEFAIGWFDIDTKTQPLRTDITNDPRLSGARYDYRFASKVRLIPEGEIDRTNTLLFPGSQPWTGRADVVEAVNKRFPWYVNRSDSLLQRAEFSPRMFTNFLPTRYNRSGNFSSLINSVVIVVHPRSHSATTVITAGTLSSTNGTLSVPFTLGQVLDIVVVVTAGDGVHTSTYTYTITRRAVN